MPDTIEIEINNLMLQTDLGRNAPIINGSGTNDYNELINKPQINNVELSGDKSFEELGDHILTNVEIFELYRRA